MESKKKKFTSTTLRSLNLFVLEDKEEEKQQEQEQELEEQEETRE
jgi:hypothetical protein